MGIGNYIKHFAKKEGRNNIWLAKKLGCHRTEISQWIEGRRKPSRERLRRLANLLRCNMSDLYNSGQFRTTYNINKEKE